MTVTSGSLRRDGRNAYYRGGDPHFHCPYDRGHFKSVSWLDGWAEAAKEDQQRIKEEENAAEVEQEKIEEFARIYNLAKEQGLIA